MKQYIQINNSKHLSYLSLETATKYMDKLIYIQNSIEEQLADYPNFNGVDFSDVSAGGIQIRGHHVKINGYTYGDQYTINSDFSNTDECITNFVANWKKQDTPEKYKAFVDFIKDGEKYGWD